MFKLKADLGRVTYVDTEKFTVDMKGLNGTEYKDINFLTLYGKPNAEGQGAYMMPELNSYGLILNFAEQYLVLGFLNYGITDDLDEGEFCFKTRAGSKIIGYNNGKLEFKASPQSWIKLFPQSGNKRDSYGYDNLLRMLVENLEITTDGGYLKHKVNKKDETTSLFFELKDKPFEEDEPNKLRCEIGADASGFLSKFKLIEDGDNIRLEKNQKPNGWKEEIAYDENGNEMYRITTTETLKRTVEIEEGEVYEQIFEPDGTFKEKIGDVFDFIRKADGEMNLVLNDGDLKINIKPNGEIDVDTNSDININTSGDVDIEADGDITIESKEDVNIKGGA